ncbi:MAG: SprT-like domain-containing protein [Streptosporangiaceae bacterium]
MEVTKPTHALYASAASLLWGEAGKFAAAEFDRLNRELFAGSIPPMPLIIAMTPYGHCIGMTMSASWLASPRITLAPEIFNGSRRLRGGPRQVADVLAHEMVHAALMLRGENADHNEPPWCAMITELSPDLTGRSILARPVRTRRVPNPAREADPAAPKSIVRRMPDPGALSQLDLARWPHSLRPADWYETDRSIHAPAY